MTNFKVGECVQYTRTNTTLQARITYITADGLIAFLDNGDWRTVGSLKKV